MKQTWSLKIGESSYGSPVIANNRVLVYYQDPPVAGLAAITFEGVLAWKHEVVFIQSCPWQSPTIVDDRVLLFDYNHISVLDIHSGCVLRQMQLERDWTGTSDALASEELSIICSNASTIVALNNRDLKREWTFAVGHGPALLTPVRRGDSVIVAVAGHGSNELLCLNAVTGQLQWRTAERFTSQAMLQCPTLWGDTVVLVTGHREEQLLALDVNNGDQLFAAPLSSYSMQGRIYPAKLRPAVVGATAVVSCGDGSVVAFDLTSLARMWTVQLQSVSEAPPVIFGKAVIVGTVDGTLSILDLAHGDIRDQIHLGAGIRAAPAICEHMVVAVSENGTIHSLEVGPG